MAPESRLTMGTNIFHTHSGDKHFSTTDRGQTFVHKVGETNIFTQRWGGKYFMLEAVVARSMLLLMTRWMGAQLIL